MLVTSDAAAKLMQVGQTIPIGLMDENRVGVGDIQTALDNRRGQQQIELMVHKPEHDFLELPLRHLSMCDLQSRLGHDLAQPASNDLNVLHAIMHKENLPVA